MARSIALPADPAFSQLPGYGWGAQVLTEDGETPVDWLAPGDRLVTRDHGMQPVLWVGLLRAPVAGLVALGPGALGGGPNEELRLPAATRILIEGWRVELHTGEAEALAPARAFTGARPGPPGPGPGIAFVLLPVHTLIAVNNLWVETLMLDAAARSALGGVLPSDLLARNDVIAGHRRAVRPALHDWEVAAIGGDGGWPGSAPLGLVA